MRLAALALVVLSLLPVAQAQEPRPEAAVILSKKPWATLSAAQREALAPLAEQWPQLDAATQEKWLNVAARFRSLNADEQQRLRQRMLEWSRLSPSERQKARIGWQDAQRVSAEERQAKWQRYQALSPEQRLALQERASQRQASKLGPATPAAQAAQTYPAIAPMLVQAHPGVSTVTLTAAKPRGSTASAPPLGGRPLKLAGLNPITLLPQAPRAASSP